MDLKSPSESESPESLVFFCSVSDSLLPGLYLSAVGGGVGSLGGARGGGVASFFSSLFSGEGLAFCLSSGLSDLSFRLSSGLADLSFLLLAGLADLLFFSGLSDPFFSTDLSDPEPLFSSSLPFFFSGDFLTRFFRLTGEAELSEDEDPLRFRRLPLLPAEEDRSEDEEEDPRLAFFFLPRDLLSDSELE